MTIDDCRKIDFPKVHDPRGNLTFIENNRHIPFKIKRIYYLYDVPGGATRAGHAHKALEQVIIAISGSFDAHIDDGVDKRTIHMNRPYYGLYISPMVWRVLDNFSSGAVCLSVVSDFYNEEDYIREYDKFLEYYGVTK